MRRALALALLLTGTSCQRPSDRPARGEVDVDVPSPGEWTVSLDGVGPYALGTSAAEVRGSAGALVDVGERAGPCHYARPAEGPAGLFLLVNDGRVARVDVSGATPTADGVGVGTPAAGVERAYAGRVSVAEGGGLTVDAGASRQFVFEVEDGRVVRYRTGLVPEVEGVAGCPPPPGPGTADPGTAR